MKSGLFFAVFTAVDAFISLEIYTLQRASVKAKNRYYNDKTRKPLGSQVLNPCGRSAYIDGSVNSRPWPPS